MATWSTKYPLNISPLGTNRQEGFEKHVLEFTEVYNYLNLVRKAQAGTVAPTAPETNDLWLDTSGTTPILKYWSGSIWAVISSPSIINRNTVLQGYVDGSGNNKLFEAGTGLAVKLNATSKEAIFTFMNGNSASQGAVDLIASINTDSALFWSSLPTNSTVYLYVDYNNGVPSGGFTTIAPVYQNYAPTHASGKHWFDFNTGKVWSSDGSTWTHRNRIVVGTATTDGTGVTAVSIYPYNDYKGSASNYVPTSYLDTDGTLAANSDSKIATQKAVKTYVKTYVDAKPSGSGAIGTGNYIAEPFSVVPGTGLEVLVGANRCVIDEVTCESTTATTVALTAKAAQLIYKKKDNTYDKLLPAMTAADLVDANTVGLWFPDGSASVPNAAVGVNGNTLAVANALTKSGTITAVDGWAGDDAAKGDGSTGYYQVTNFTGIPSGANNIEFNFLISVGALGANQCIVDYGSAVGGQRIFFYVSATGNLMVNNHNSNFDTGYVSTAGQLYLLTLQYNGGSILVYVNGNFVYSVTLSLAISQTFLRYLMQNGGIAYGNHTIHFIEIRNALRTPAQIATLAQKLLIPCAYGTTDIRDALTNKAESQVVAFVRTSATVPTLIVAPNDPKGATPDWAYGMRVGPMGSRNKRKFLGWKYSDWSVPSRTLSWENPFGADELLLDYFYSSDGVGTDFVRVMGWNTNAYEVRSPSKRIAIFNAASNGWASTTLGTSYKTTGYIGCYAEVID